MNLQVVRRPSANPSPPFKLTRHQGIAVVLLIALFAFEIFNFDTTRYALDNLLGGVSFIGLKWASILAVAFCAIDFAGLAKIFTPERGADEPKEVWYLMGAWLLGATMNAIMTWWAVSLTLLEGSFGNEVLSRAQLLTYVPIFVAVLVWLTRILFIGALTVAGEQIFHGDGAQAAATTSDRRVRQARPTQSANLRATAAPRHRPIHNENEVAELELAEDDTMVLFEPHVEVAPVARPQQPQLNIRPHANRRSSTNRRPKTQVPVPNTRPRQYNRVGGA